MAAGHRLVVILLALAGALAGSAVGSQLGARDEPAAPIDLGALVREVERRPAAVAAGRYRGATCAALARQLGRRLERSFRALPRRRPGFDAGRVWSAQVAELNLLAREQAQRGLSCDGEQVMRDADRQLSAAFRRAAHRHVPVWQGARDARDHAEWRASVAALIDAGRLRLREHERCAATGRAIACRP